MEIYVHTSEPRDAKNHPRPTCRKKQEADNSKPHGGNAIESSYQGIGVAKCQQRRCQEADRQNSNGHLKPYGRRLIRWRRKRLRLINEKVRQEQYGLNDADKRDDSGSFTHNRLDSPSRENGICLLPALRPSVNAKRAAREPASLPQSREACRQKEPVLSPPNDSSGVGWSWSPVSAFPRC